MTQTRRSSTPVCKRFHTVQNGRTGSAAARLSLLAGLTAVLAACGAQKAPAEDPAITNALTTAQLQLRAQNLGPNVKIFDPSMPQADIQKAVDDIYAKQVGNQFGSERYALMFKPGTYGTAANPLIVKVGYYTEVAGLGALPTDVTINGHVDVYNQCTTNADGTQNCIALNNFWRSASNLTVNVEKLNIADGCRNSGNFWAVSQASPLRRFNVVGGNLTLMDYCTAGPQYASGGFISDSQAGTVINGSQQQFLTRNSKVTNWTNGVWNQVFSGVEGAPAQSFGQTGTDGKPAQPYTTLAATPVSREKPYLYVDAAGKYKVFVPATQTNSAGVTWANGQGAGKTLDLESFFVAKPGDSVALMNAALARGLNVMLTPGVYDMAQSLRIKKSNTVVLGLGVATLNAVRGAVPMTVADVPGVDVSGLMFDAGDQTSPVLLQLGGRRGFVDGNYDDGDFGARESGTAQNPAVLHDVYFRIGGAHVGKATAALVINSDNAVLDHVWAWRADHGDNNSFGWTVSTADTGLVVNADNVTALGLFVEHFQKNEVIWNGENGKTIMFQNEMPYDAPNQAAWRAAGPVLGYAAYKVADTVKTHEGWGLGSYIYTNVDPSIHATHGFEVPVTPGVRLHDLLTVQLGAGTLDHVVNDTGAAVDSSTTGKPSNVINFP